MTVDIKYHKIKIFIVNIFINVNEKCRVSYLENGISISRHLKGYISVGWITYISHTDALFGTLLQNALVITHVETHQITHHENVPCFYKHMPKTFTNTLSL